MISVLVMDNLRSSSVIWVCRICHEEEVESCRSLEAPCACSGTLKFAHRDCIQRWCSEKGNTTCEICLQKFRPGYTSPPKITHSLHTTVTIRGGTGGYPFSLLTVLIVKAGGILVPMYTLIRILAVIHNRIKYQGYQNPDMYLLSSDDEDGEQHSNAEIQP
ncbi:UNVERIFIED_CONTAM: putative E3 ubiquitin ligase SUD1 [Sesamum radiatum]|uniref:E3 ubiquitin ligase SUD1 n=1 Tax=Sesamum radiatum TaxID=300843 RepID=A0AAW2WAJ2_SESRA